MKKQLSRPIVHFVGIGGIGISALARYFLSEGWKISGSDLVQSDTTDELKTEGAIIHIGKHKQSNISANANLVIYNQAIDQTNPELLKAEKLKIPSQSYPQALGKLTRKYKTIAIAGSHGKSTTTALAALTLIEGGLDPTVILGTKLKEFGNKNFRKGKSEWLIIEADEWKASFLNYSPALAVITNVDKEHLDFYKNFAAVQKTFNLFKKQCEKILTPPTDIKLKNEIKEILKIPGQHNVENALLAYAIGKELKIPRKIILGALSKYKGAWRRMEYKGKTRIVSLREISRRETKRESPNSKRGEEALVFDDYAHHPTEIRATLSAFKEKYHNSFLICVFQPHQAARLKALFKEFKKSFEKADAVVLLPTYEVAGRDQKSDPRHDSQALAKAIEAAYVKNPRKNLKQILEKILRLVKLTTSFTKGGKNLTAKPYIPYPKESGDFASRGLAPNPIIIMMGAGDVVEYTKLLTAND